MRWLPLALSIASVAGAQERPRPDVERAFAFFADPHGPGQGGFLMGYSLSGGSSAGAIRPLPGNLDARGLVHAIELEAGAHARLGFYADVLIAQPLDEGNKTVAAVRTGARILLSPPGARWRLQLDGGMVREFGGDIGISAEITGSVDLGRVRLAATAHVEHLFGAGRDPVDLWAVAGVSVRVAAPLRLGVEYVLEDIEAAWEDDEAEGGLRHYLGPNLALRLARGRVLITGGVAVQLAQTPGLLGRAAFAYAY